MSLNNSLNNGMNEARTGHSEVLSPGRCPASKQHGSGRHQITARKKWTKEENKTATSCYLKATKESKRGYRKRMHNPWNEMGMFEIEEQHLACQVRSLFKNNTLQKLRFSNCGERLKKLK